MINININNIQKEKGDWGIIVNANPGSFNVDVWLFKKDGARVFLANTSIDGYLELKEVKDGAEDKRVPLMRVPYDAWGLIIEAIADHAPPIKKEIVEAELLATKFHLNDMRNLTFYLLGKNKKKDDGFQMEKLFKMPKKKYVK